jgi:type II secretory pathway pseudopilin PulG
MPSACGFTLLELLVLLLVAALLLSVAIPSMLHSRQLAREASAAARLRDVHPFQSAFRQNDLDGNGQQDFWTLDWSGLHRVTDASGAPLALIPAGLAAADAAPADSTTGPRPAIGVALASAAAEGYWYRAMTGSPAKPYQKDGPDADTDARENALEYGFTAFPHAGSGRFVYFTTESGVVWFRDFGGPGPGGAAPKGARVLPGIEGGQLEWPGAPGAPDPGEEWGGMR